MLGGVIPMGAVFLESFAIMPWHVMIRFGKWNDVIAEPIPTDTDAYAGTIANGHYAKAVAYASTGMVAKARAQQALFKEALKNKKLKGRLLHNNPMWADDGPSVLGVAAKVMEGEILYREAVLGDGSCDAAFAALRDAIELSENLTYDEPWGWMVPVRHALGALLFEQGRVDEATEVYRKDVLLWRDNMWGLFGLVTCLKKAGAPAAEIREYDARYQHATIRADVKLKATCFCAAMAGATTKSASL